MKLTADITEKAKQLPGGKNVTKARLAKLLEEVEQGRQRSADQVSQALRFPEVQEALEKMEDAAVRKASGFTALDTSPTDYVGPDLTEDDDLDPDVADALKAPISNPLDAAGQKQAESQQVKILMAEIAQMKAKIADLSTPQSENAAKDAIVSGKLPVGGPAPGPVGYTGSAQLPRGVWFVGPFGPKIEMYLCECSECSPTRFQHYFCPVCRSGPHRYTDGLGGKRDHMAPGSTWGISHVACSFVCWSRYEELTRGRAPVRVPGGAGQRHPMVAGTDSGIGPSRPVVAATSD